MIVRDRAILRLSSPLRPDRAAGRPRPGGPARARSGRAAVASLRPLPPGCRAGDSAAGCGPTSKTRSPISSPSLSRSPFTGRGRPPGNRHRDSDWTGRRAVRHRNSGPESLVRARPGLRVRVGLDLDGRRTRPGYLISLRLPR